MGCCEATRLGSLRDGDADENLCCNPAQEARGYVVRSIPYYDWCALDGLEQQQAYPWRLLASALPPLLPAVPPLPLPAHNGGDYAAKAPVGAGVE